MPADPSIATEARAQYAAERAARDPSRLRQAARIARVGRRLGLLDDDLYLVDDDSPAAERAS